MKAFISWLVILTLYYNSVSGQTRIILDGPSRIDSVRMRMQIIFVDTFKTTMNYLVINPDHIKSINIFKGSTAILRFGEAGKYWTIKIYSKKKTTILPFDKKLNEKNKIK